jgi:6-phosphogluconate dehydrogenase (decarboxylating)
MVPAAVVDEAIADILPLLERGDILIDGGNSYDVDHIRRAKEPAREASTTWTSAERVAPPGGWHDPVTN